MRLPIAVHHRCLNLSRIPPKVAFPSTLRTSSQRQTLSPNLLQFRAATTASLSDNERRHFLNQMRRLVHSQKELEGLETKGGVSWHRFHNYDNRTSDEANAIWDKINAVDEEQLMIVHDIAERASLERRAGLSVSRRRSGVDIGQLIEEKYAEPLARLTPDELKLIDKVFRRIRKDSRKVVIKVILRKVAKLAASFGVAYWLFRYLTANWR